MSLNFPANPADNDTYSGYIYNSAKGVWNKIANTTDSVSEGTQNLYFTDQRALDATAAAYDASGSAATAESNANTYTDGEISSLDTSLKSYADTAEADAITASNSYADGLAVNYDAAGSADTAEANAKSYTDDLIGDGTVDGTAGNTVSDRIATAVSDLVDSAPEALDTLNELAAALGDDENFSTTVTNAIAAKADSDSPSFTGTVDFSGATISGVSIDDLSDVSTSGVTDGQALVYDTTSTSWVPGSVAIDALNDIADVDTTGAQDGYVLTYDTSSTSWTAQEASGGGGGGGGLSDIISVDAQTVGKIYGEVWTSSSSTFLSGFSYEGADISGVAYNGSKYLLATRGAFFGEEAQLRESTDLLSWTTVSSQVQIDRVIQDVAYGDGKWVLAGSYLPDGNGGEGEGEGEVFVGDVFVSTDLSVWTSYPTPIGYNDFVKIQYIDNKWVGAGRAYNDNYSVAISTDLISWSLGSGLTNVSNNGGVASFNNKYYIGNYRANANENYPVILESTDLYSWTSVAANLLAVDMSIVSIAADSESLVIVNNDTDNEGILRSTDAINWTTTYDNIPSVSEYSEIISPNGFGFIFKENYSNVITPLKYSTDGISWLENSEVIESQSMSFANDLIILGGTSNNNGSVSYSTGRDFFETINYNLTSDNSNDLIKIGAPSVAYVNVPKESTSSIPVKTQINLVQSGTAPIVFEPERGPDKPSTLTGQDWTSVSIGTKQEYVMGMMYDGSKYVLVTKGSFFGEEVLIKESSDLSTWTTVSSQTQIDRTIAHAAYGDGKWVLLGNYLPDGDSGEGEGEGEAFYDPVFVSTDLQVWTSYVTPSEFGNMNTIQYINGKWIATGRGEYGSGASVMHSTDAANWTASSYPADLTKTSQVAYDGQKYFVANDNAEAAASIYESTDLLVWTSVNTVGLSGRANAIEYLNGKYTVFSSGSFYGSTDSINWTQGTNVGTGSGQTAYINVYGETSRIINDGYNFVAKIGQLSPIRYSTDGLNWTDSEEIAPLNLNFTFANNTAFVNTNSSQSDLYYSTYVLGPGDPLVTLNATPGLKTRDQWSAATLVKIDTDEWIIMGDLSA